MGTIVHTTTSEGLVTGLSWSVLSSESDRLSPPALRRKIRRQGALLGASRYVLNRLTHASHLGLYSPPVLQRDATPPRLHALALVFLAAFTTADKNTINAMLLMPVDGDPDRRVLVVIEGGQVVHDKIEQGPEAIALVQKYRQTTGLHYSVVSHFAEVPDATLVTWPQLLASAAKATELHSLPKNMALLLGLVTLAVGATLATSYYHWVVAPAKARAALLAKAAQENHTPAYLQSVQQGLARSGWQIEDLQQTLQRFHQEPAYIKGWALQSITCQFDTADCAFRYERVGGEVAELVKLLQGKTYDVATSGKELAVFRHGIQPKAHMLTRAALPPRDDWAVALRSPLQRLTNAGVQVALAPGVAWPSQGIDMNKVDKNVVVTQTPVNLSLPWVVLPSVLPELPTFVAWRSVVVQINHGADATSMIHVLLKGHSYVQ